VTAFIDTAVIMYSAGGDHPLREPCGRIIEAIGDGDFDAVTSVEVIQEIFHRFLSVGRADEGRAQAVDAIDLFAPVIPLTHALIRRVPDLARKYPSLSARDLVHVATCIHEGIVDIVSPDRGFDQVAEIRRIDPTAFASEPT